MPALTSGQLKQAVADSQQVPVTTLSARWDRICDMAVDDAFQDIVTHFIGRGYNLDQINGWDRLTSLHRLQGLYWAFVHGAGLHNFSDQWVNKLDQRSGMADMAITQSGGILAGGGNTDAFIEFGRFDSTQDAWTRDTPI